MQRREDQKRAEGTGKGTRSLTLGAMRENPEAWSCGEGARAKEMRERGRARKRHRHEEAKLTDDETGLLVQASSFESREDCGIGER